MRIKAVILLACLTVPAIAAAQSTGSAKFDRLAQRWAEILTAVVAEKKLTLVDEDDRPVSSVRAAHHVKGDAEAVRAAYSLAMDRLLAHGDVSEFYTPDARKIGEESRPSDQEWVQKLIDVRADEKGAKSLNGGSTNPAAPRVAERSGFTDFLAVALDSQHVVSADDTAVSLSLNALAALGLDGNSVRSAPALYREHDLLRRFGGTVSFGAKVPEGEITGLTGLPSAGTLFDVFAWDAKVRLVGDRDPRAKRWDHLMLGVLGGAGEILDNLRGTSPRGDLHLLSDLAKEKVDRAKGVVNERLRSSGQVTFKAGGQHLTKEKGKNKYSFGILADKGMGTATDVTFNALYSIVDDVSLGADKMVTLETWTIALALNHTRWRDVIVKGRAAELSFNANFEFPIGKEPLLPKEREKVWRLIGAIALPLGDTAKIPISVTYVSDPNSLTKEKFVTGHVGVTYDFGALKNFLKPSVQK
jgi:hypothetical protein